MAIRVTLDGRDITESLKQQYPLPDSSASGVFPDRSAGRWYNLLPCINADPVLKANFFNGDTNGNQYGGVHELKMTDENGRSFQMRVLVRMKYSARNH